MEERILNLLSLCMDAQEKGHNVSFDCSDDLVTVFHHSSVDSSQKVIECFCIYRNTDDFDTKLSIAEAYLKGLISCGITKA